MKYTDNNYKKRKMRLWRRIRGKKSRGVCGMRRLIHKKWGHIYRGDVGEVKFW